MLSTQSQSRPRQRWPLAEWIISGELLREQVLNLRAPIPANDGIDLVHAVDAVDYCDLVVLGKTWERRVKNLRRSIEAAGLNMPVAQSFSMRDGGIGNFLDAIEQWPDPAKMARSSHGEAGKRLVEQLRFAVPEADSVLSAASAELYVMNRRNSRQQLFPVQLGNSICAWHADGKRCLFRVWRGDVA